MSQQQTSLHSTTATITDEFSFALQDNYSVNNSMSQSNESNNNNATTIFNELDTTTNDMVPSTCFFKSESLDELLQIGLSRVANEEDDEKPFSSENSHTCAFFPGFSNYGESNFLGNQHALPYIENTWDPSNSSSNNTVAVNEASSFLKPQHAFEETTSFQGNNENVVLNQLQQQQEQRDSPTSHVLQQLMQRFNLLSDCNTSNCGDVNFTYHQNAVVNSANMPSPTINTNNNSFSLNNKVKQERQSPMQTPTTTNEQLVNTQPLVVHIPTPPIYYNPHAAYNSYIPTQTAMPGSSSSTSLQPAFVNYNTSFQGIPPNMLHPEYMNINNFEGSSGIQQQPYCLLPFPNHIINTDNNNNNMSPVSHSAEEEEENNSANEASSSESDGESNNTQRNRIKKKEKRKRGRPKKVPQYKVEFTEHEFSLLYNHKEDEFQDLLVRSSRKGGRKRKVPIFQLVSKEHTPSRYKSAVE
ncbi:hypothetical protein ABK040_012016 [Willaertia magna]